MRHSLPQTWNARFRISVTPRTDMRSALQHNPRNCSDGPALTQWAWQITMRSILARSHCTIPQRSYFEKKLSQSELKHQTGRLAIRVFSLCPMEKESPWSRSAMLTLRQIAKSLRPLFERSLLPRLRKRGHTQILSFAWSTGESKTARRSLTNNANSPVG